MEGLFNALSKTASSRALHGYKIVSNAPSIMHILFVDDSFLFFKTNIEETNIVKALLKEYEEYSG